MKKTIIIFLFIALLFTACQKNTNDLISDSYDEDNNEIIFEKYDTGYSITDDLFDYQMKIDNTVYQFPMSVEEVKKCGWNFDEYEDSNATLKSGYDDLVWFVYPDGSKIIFRVANFDNSERLISDCYVIGIQLDINNLVMDMTKISFAKGITLGISTKEDIITAFGEATKTEVSEYNTISHTILIYEEKIYNRIEFTVDNNDGILCNVEIENFEKPNNFISFETSNEIPNIITNYKQPTALGSSIVSGIVDIDGILYQMPIPITELTKNGWEIDSNTSDETLQGSRYGYVTLIKDDKKISNAYVKNYSDNEVYLENGCICQLDTTNLYNTSLTLPNNISVDMSVNELENKINGESFTIENRYGSIIYSFIRSGDNLNNGVFITTEENKIQYFYIKVE